MVSETGEHRQQQPRRKRHWAIWAVSILTAVVVVLVGYIAFLILFPAQVPDLHARTIDEASNTLYWTSLRLGTTGQIATTSVGPGLIALQRPLAGSSVPRRSSVDVTVAVTPTTAKVPSVSGQDAAQASETLTKALFVPDPVDTYGSSAPVGSVVEQVPAAGTKWMTGWPVGLELSSGPADENSVKVPDLVGSTLPSATAELQKLGLGASAFVEHTKSPHATTVATQQPKPAVLVKRGQTVLLYTQLP